MSRQFILYETIQETIKRRESDSSWRKGEGVGGDYSDWFLVICNMVKDNGMRWLSG